MLDPLLLFVVYLSGYTQFGYIIYYVLRAWKCFVMPTLSVLDGAIGWELVSKGLFAWKLKAKVQEPQSSDAAMLD